MKNKGIATFCPANPLEWRQWLIDNHQSKQAVWLIYYKKKANIGTITWSEAVDEALCFGWIDSVRKSGDGDTFIQFFSKRKPNSGWSKINKGKVLGLIDNGLMAKAGLDSIEIAKQNGSWTLLDDVEELKIPEDMAEAFGNHRGSEAYFLSLSKSVRKAVLQWLVTAKRPETRSKRIAEIAELAVRHQKPKQFS